MPTTGYLKVIAYTSRARIPLEDVAVTVVSDEGKLLALRITDSSGMTGPISLSVPDRQDSLSPGNGTAPYGTVNIYARGEGYEQILVREVQVFPGVVTLQELAMVPLSELPGSRDQEEIFDTPPQNL